MLKEAKCGERAFEQSCRSGGGMNNRTGLALWGLAGLVLAAGLGTILLAHHKQPAPAPAASEPQLETALPRDYDEVAMKLDPKDYEVMQPVCTRCHSAGFILHSRPWSSWQGVFQQMYGYGVRASPEQWDHIYRFTERYLTLLDVNDADEDELSAVLGVDEKTAIAMVQRRSDRKFETAADVEAVPGVDKKVIEAMKPRLIFDKFPENE